MVHSCVILGNPEVRQGIKNALLVVEKVKDPRMDFWKSFTARKIYIINKNPQKIETNHKKQCSRNRKGF